jgi:hypothetical protein
MTSAQRPDTRSDDGVLDSAAFERTGPFWDAVEGQIPLPHAAATLGLEFVDADLERRTHG